MTTPAQIAFRKWFTEWRKGVLMPVEESSEAHCAAWEVWKLKDAQIVDAVERCAKICDDAEQRYTEDAKEALAKGQVLMGHRQLVAAYLGASIRELKYDAALNPYQQMAAGNHSIGIVKDGKLIATDAEVCVSPDTKDAERYRELRKRVEVRYERAVSGSSRRAFSIVIGRAFLDSKINPRYNDEERMTKLDDAVDSLIQTHKQESK